jgi:hypothetical protein
MSQGQGQGPSGGKISVCVKHGKHVCEECSFAGAWTFEAVPQPTGGELKAPYQLEAHSADYRAGYASALSTRSEEVGKIIESANRLMTEIEDIEHITSNGHVDQLRFFQNVVMKSVRKCRAALLPFQGKEKP